MNLVHLVLHLLQGYVRFLIYSFTLLSDLLSNLVGSSVLNVVLWRAQQGSVVTSVGVGSLIPQVHRQPFRKLHLPTGRRKVAKFLVILK